MKNKTIKNHSGFTLVEIMVVIAIIGIISSVGTIQFQTYQAKSRTTEAKISLSSVYTAEVVFRSNTDFYGTCLPVLGYLAKGAIDGNSDNIISAAEDSPELRNYNVGFGVAQDNAAIGIPIRYTESRCTQANADGEREMWFAGTSTGNSAQVPSGLATVTPNSFLIEANGRVISSELANSDRWTMDNEKQLIHVQTGY